MGPGATENTLQTEEHSVPLVSGGSGSSSEDDDHYDNDDETGSVHTEETVCHLEIDDSRPIPYSTQSSPGPLKSNRLSGRVVVHHDYHDHLHDPHLDGSQGGCHNYELPQHSKYYSAKKGCNKVGPSSFANLSYDNLNFPEKLHYSELLGILLASCGG
jgi:hypothetical protein